MSSIVFKVPFLERIFLIRERYCRIGQGYSNKLFAVGVFTPPHSLQRGANDRPSVGR